MKIEMSKFVFDKLHRSSFSVKFANETLRIGLLQQKITWYKIRHTGGQAHYYSRTGTFKERDLNQSTLTGLCFNVPVQE